MYINLCIDISVYTCIVVMSMSDYIYIYIYAHTYISTYISYDLHYKLTTRLITYKYENIFSIILYYPISPILYYYSTSLSTILRLQRIL